MNLDKFRQHIDRVDRQIVRLLNRRAEIVQRIGRLKKDRNHEIYVPAREKMVLDHVRRINGGPLSGPAIQSIYREIMSSCLALEHPVSVAYLGPPSTFTHQAARLRFGGSVRYVACETIGDVFETVQKKGAEYGVVPIENSTEGAVTYTLDECVGTSLKICAEIYLPISNNLMARIPRGKIRRIYSMPQVFGQCRRWLNMEMPGIELIPVSSTARAAEMAAKEKAAGAIASRLAAELHGLKLLAADIQDLTGNVTRFLVIGRAYGHATGDDKTSILFSVKHRAGALCNALEALKKCGLNMTKIESRPSKLKAWEYFFFVDVEGHSEETRVRKALAELARHCTLLTVLGAYPKAPEGRGEA